MKLLIDVNQLLWNGPILVMLFGTHVYFTLRLRLVQRKIGYGISLSLSDGSKNKKGFGRFGSLTTTLAATLGTGNIIGISTAVFLGGPANPLTTAMPFSANCLPNPAAISLLS